MRSGPSSTSQSGPSSSGSRGTPGRPAAKLARQRIMEGSPGGKARKVTVEATVTEATVNVTILAKERA